eukprot:gene106-3498_t
MTDKRLADEQLTADDVDKSGDASPEPQGAFPRASESTLAQRRITHSRKTSTPNPVSFGKESPSSASQFKLQPSIYVIVVVDVKYYLAEYTVTVQSLLLT